MARSRDERGAAPLLAGLIRRIAPDRAGLDRRGVERAVGRAVELAAACSSLVEIAILFAGVVSRYVFHRPFIWSDELASILFLWLAMLGAVVALRRGEHMRMSALVSDAAPRRRGALPRRWRSSRRLAFLAADLQPALEYADRRGDHRDAGARDRRTSGAPRRCRSAAR